jgi:hypothetical protein
MEQKEYYNTESSLNKMEEENISYESLDIERRKKAILSSDTEKFKMFSKLMRIGIMMKNAKVTHQKMPE